MLSYGAKRNMEYDTLLCFCSITDKFNKMDKLKILLPIIPLLIIPILCNLWLLILYPIFFISSFFWNDKDFTKQISNYINSMAKIEKNKA